MKYVPLGIAAALVLGILWSLPSGRGPWQEAGLDAPLHLDQQQPAVSVASRPPELNLAFGRHVPTPAPVLTGSQSQGQTVFVTVEVEGPGLEIGVLSGPVK